MVSYAVERNLPLFKRDRVVSQEDKFYIQGKIGSDNFLGVMNSTPRKEYFAYVESYNGKEGVFKLGKIEYTKVNKLKLVDGSSISIEVIPNKSGGIIHYSEYVPSYSASHLKFSEEELKMSMIEWIKFVTK